MEEENRGRGRGYGLIDRTKKKSDEASPETSSQEPQASTASSASTSSGRGILNPVKLKEKVPGGEPQTSTSSAPASDGSRPRGLALLDTLRARKSATTSTTTSGVYTEGDPKITTTERSIASITRQLAETPITVTSEQSSQKSKNKYFKEVKETPPVVNKGTTGRPVEVTANFIRLNFKENCVFEYEVKYEPDQIHKGLRYKLLNEHSNIIKVHTFDGTTLYLPESLEREETKLMSTNPYDGEKIELTIKYRRNRRLSEMIHIYNVLFKQIMKDLDLVRFNRQHFNQHALISIPQHRLEVWPGYVTAIDEYEGGLMLTLDSTHRVLRTLDVRTFISETITRHRDGSNYKQALVEALVGCSVMTSYNKKLYRVDSIDFSSSPRATFEKKDENGEIIHMSYIEYYKRNYGIDIKDFDQPMLVSRKTKKVVGEAEPTDFMFYLVPELCKMTGLTDDLKNDNNLMKDVATYTRITPNQRHAAFKQYLRNVMANPKAKSRLAGWGLSIAPETIDLIARVLPPETLLFGNDVKVPGQDNANWNNDATRNAPMEAMSLCEWNVLYTKRDERLASDFVETMLRVAKPMGMMMHKPKMVTLRSESTLDYINGLKSLNSSICQMAVVICPNARDDRYATIKKICCVDNVIPSQVINARTLKNPSKIRSITQKIALQINCKLGGTLWGINIPFKSAMVIGIDSYHDRRNKSVCGYVASYNKHFTKWYSRVIIQEKGQEILDGLKSCLISSLNHYFRVNGELPEKIIIYRDGVGDGQLKLLQEYEIPQLKVCFSLVKEKYKPSLTFIVVQKRINTRIFLKLNGQFENPPPGTVLDYDVTRRDWFDFLIVSQKVNQGTVTPSHYIVISDDSGIDADKWQRLTYKMCHLYYNWPGTIRVPAPCQYAHKLAYLVGQSIQKTPSEKLWDKLYFL